MTSKGSFGYWGERQLMFHRQSVNRAVIICILVLLTSLSLPAIGIAQGIQVVPSEGFPGDNFSVFAEEGATCTTSTGQSSSGETMQFTAPDIVGDIVITCKNANDEDIGTGVFTVKPPDGGNGGGGGDSGGGEQGGEGEEEDEMKGCRATPKFANSVNARSAEPEPVGLGLNSPVVGVLFRGQEYAVIGITQDRIEGFYWYKVSFSDGREGYSREDVIQLSGDCSNLPGVPVQAPSLIQVCGKTERPANFPPYLWRLYAGLQPDDPRCEAFDRLLNPFTDPILEFAPNALLVLAQCQRFGPEFVSFLYKLYDFRNQSPDRDGDRPLSLINEVIDPSTGNVCAFAEQIVTQQGLPVDFPLDPELRLEAAPLICSRGITKARYDQILIFLGGLQITGDQLTGGVSCDIVRSANRMTVMTDDQLTLYQHINTTCPDLGVSDRIALGLRVVQAVIEANASITDSINAFTVAYCSNAVDLPIPFGPNPVTNLPVEAAAQDRLKDCPVADLAHLANHVDEGLIMPDEVRGIAYSADTCQALEEYILFGRKPPVISVTPTPSASLSLSIQSATNTAIPGDLINYTVTISNPATALVEQAELTIFLPQVLRLESIDSKCSADSSRLQAICQNLSVPVQGQVEIGMTVRVLNVSRTLSALVTARVSTPNVDGGLIFASRSVALRIVGTAPSIIQNPLVTSGVPTATPYIFPTLTPQPTQPPPTPPVIPNATGAILVFTATNTANGQSSIWYLENGDIGRLNTGDESATWPALDPTGRRVAYIVNDGPEASVNVQTIPLTEVGNAPIWQLNLTRSWMKPEGFENWHVDLSRLAWRPDGKALLITYVNPDTGERALFVLRLTNISRPPRPKLVVMNAVSPTYYDESALSEFVIAYVQPQSSNSDSGDIRFVYTDEENDPTDNLSLSASEISGLPPNAVCFAPNFITESGGLFFGCEIDGGIMPYYYAYNAENDPTRVFALLDEPQACRQILAGPEPRFFAQCTENENGGYIFTHYELVIDPDDIRLVPTTVNESLIEPVELRGFVVDQFAWITSGQ